MCFHMTLGWSLRHWALCVVELGKALKGKMLGYCQYGPDSVAKEAIIRDINGDYLQRGANTTIKLLYSLWAILTAKASSETELVMGPHVRHEGAFYCLPGLPGHFLVAVILQSRLWLEVANRGLEEGCDYAVGPCSPLGIIIHAHFNKRATRLWSLEEMEEDSECLEYIDSHVKRLDEDLSQFAEDLKQEGKIAPDEPAILPPTSTREEKRKGYFFTPQTKRLESKVERDWEKDRDRDFELMPPPGSHKRTIPAPVDVDQPIDPNEPTYCVCHQVSFGDMIACDNENCEGGEWFHYACVGLTSETRFKGKWYCPTCRLLPRRGALDPPA
eukprot:Gb_23205 [translate_table: standard]